MVHLEGAPVSDEVKEVKPRSWSTMRGGLELRVMGAGVVLVRCSGFCEAALLPHFYAEMKRAVPADVPLHMFFDGADVEGYETPFRTGLTEWLRAEGKRVVGAHALVRSKLVAMGASLASLALGGSLKVQHSRPVFEGLIQTALRNATQR